MDLKDFCQRAYNVAEVRRSNGGAVDTTPSKMLKHCATEVVEAVEAYEQWQTDLRFGPLSIGVTDPEFVANYKQDFIDELADIVSCVAIIAGGLNIDLESALERCYQKNLARSEGRGDKK